MHLIIHRGSKEIGGTCVELSAANSKILIDFGMPLVDGNQKPFDSKILIGKSVEDLKKCKILPDIKGLYPGEKKAVDAILISHSHMDHYGLLRYVHPDVLIYVSDGARRLIEISDIFIPSKVGKINSQELPKNQKTMIGDLAVTSFLVDHSAFDALAFLIEVDGKRLFYSGDFRAHGRKSKLFDRMLIDPPKNVDCLLMEGSMLGRSSQRYEDETAVEDGMVKILRKKKNLAFLFVSSQNIDRLVSAYRACLKTDSTFVIDVYTAYILHELGSISKYIPQFNWRNIRIKFFKYHADSLANAGYKELLYLFKGKKIEMEEINANKEKMLMVLRDNSLFPRVLNKMNGVAGATIIYSMWEGYLTDKFKDFCNEKGITIEQVHTSGHATLGDLQDFASAINPKVLIPIHTFEPKKYVELFENVKILEDGEELTI